MEVVRWTIFEEMEGERGALSFPTRMTLQSSKMQDIGEIQPWLQKLKKAIVIEKLRIIVVKIDFAVGCWEKFIPR